MDKARVTVVIPTIPPRRAKLEKAVNSVLAQDYEGKIDIKIAIDYEKLGSAKTRNRALSRVRTPWTAFLDDDDYLLPNHIRTLLDNVDDMDAPKVVYSGCKVVGPNGVEIPRQDEWGRFGKDFDGDLLRQQSYVPVTSLVWTPFAQDAQFGPPDHDPTSVYDDWGFYLRMLDLGVDFKHIPVVTWVWVHDQFNTSGESSRW
jgi:glycosyltransferase involved in cell wall biosynthesis